MLINSIDEMKQFLPSLMMKTADSPLLRDAIYSADTWLRQHVTGEDMYAKVEGGGIADDNVLHRLMSQSISLTAFLSVMADLDVALTDAGFVVVQDAQMVPASKARVDKLEASLKFRRLDCLSGLIFQLRSCREWLETSQCKHLCRSFVATKDELLSYVPGLNLPDFETFTAFQDRIMTALYNDISSWVPLATVKELNSRYTAATLETVEEMVVRLIIQSAAAFVKGKDGSQFALKAYALLKSSPEEFPYFVDPLSKVSQNNNSAVVNML